MTWDERVDSVIDLHSEDIRVALAVVLRDRDSFRDLTREANAMLGLDVDPASEWGDWRQRVAAALDEKQGT